MIKKIKVEQLRPGVFVHDFNCGWLHHPFLADRTILGSEKDIAKVIKYGIRELYIDTDKGLDIDDAPTGAEAQQELQSELDQVIDQATPHANNRPAGDEMVRAKQLIAEAKLATKKLMHDVKLGKRMEMSQVENIVEQMTDSVLRNGDALVSLLRIKDADAYTYLHSMAVSALCVSFAQGLEFDAREIMQIGIGGLLHDIGKMTVPPEILNKPGPLTEREFDIMKRHVKNGKTILQEYPHLDQACTCVTAHHHERLDGTGYPEGLQGDQISMFGQIAAIVDIYDALSSERCYKKALAPTEALRKLFEWSQSYLNRQLIEKFVAHLGIFPIGTLVRLESSLLAVVVGHGENSLLRPRVRAVYDLNQVKRIAPFDIDLDHQYQAGNHCGIIACESAEKWHIRTEEFLP